MSSPDGASSCAPAQVERHTVTAKLANQAFHLTRSIDSQWCRPPLGRHRLVMSEKLQRNHRIGEESRSAESIRQSIEKITRRVILPPSVKTSGELEEQSIGIL